MMKSSGFFNHLAKPVYWDRFHRLHQQHIQETLTRAHRPNPPKSLAHKISPWNKTEFSVTSTNRILAEKILKQELRPFKAGSQPRLDISTTRKRRRERAAVIRSNHALLLKIRDAKSSLPKGRNPKRYCSTIPPPRDNGQNKILHAKVDMPDTVKTFTTIINGQQYYFLIKKKGIQIVMYAFSGANEEMQFDQRYVKRMPASRFQDILSRYFNNDMQSLVSNIQINEQEQLVIKLDNRASKHQSPQKKPLTATTQRMQTRCTRRETQRSYSKLRESMVLTRAAEKRKSLIKKTMKLQEYYDQEQEQEICSGRKDGSSDSSDLFSQSFLDDQRASADINYSA